jgi:predicted TIM-barrel fold metal-dependent hydrolase
VRIDVHQHLLTEPLIAALAARRRPPRVRREGSGWVLELYADPDHPITPAETDVEARAAQLEQDGIERALVCLSTVFGVESLPRAEAQPLLDAYAEGVRGLPQEFGHWASACVSDPQPDELDEHFGGAEGAVGLAMPAGALGGAKELAHVAPLLERLERLDAPLLVHPGPAPGFEAQAPPPPHPATPAWWPALTRYVYEIHTAWLAFIAYGRAQHPHLRVVFVMLAGLAPLHLERLVARGGPAQDGIDRNVFFDTSSYGPRAIDAMVRAVGVDQLVYGSDRPYADPQRWTQGAVARHATAVTNPARLLGPRRSPPPAPRSSPAPPGSAASRARRPCRATRPSGSA